MNLVPNLGMVIDLTFTDKYYNPTVVFELILSGPKN